jgi:hypothetical protein
LIGEKERYHGVAIARLVQDADGPVVLEHLGTTSRSAYRVNSARVLYLKYSTKRLSPWTFSFSTGQRRELDEFGQAVLVVLICGNEGVAAVDWTVLWKSLLSEVPAEFALRVSRRDGHQFRITAARGIPLLAADADYVRLALA